jgi:general stress protein 26
MPKPQPPALDPAQLPALARAVLQNDRFPVLATIDGDKPRVRPVSPVRTDEGTFVIYVANMRFYAKTAQIAANPNVELCYMDDHHNQLRITGVADILTGRPLLEEIWNTNPLMRQYLGSLDNPQLIVYRITPNKVRYMQEWASEYYDVPLT